MTQKSGDGQQRQSVDKINSYKKLFASDDGKIVLYDLMKESYMLSSTADPISHLASRNEGKREIMIYILRMIETETSTLYQMINRSKLEDASYANKDPI